MRIIIDIGHPAHVHHFKNVICRLQQKGHQVKIVTMDKDITLSLLNAYGFNYDIIGKNQGGGLGKKAFLYFRSVFPVVKIAITFTPDIFISRGSPSIGVVSKILRKPYICFSDTEHAKLSNLLAFPFADVICTPSCFKKDLGKKQVRYNGYHELAYLHPNYFKPDPSVLGELGLSEGERFIVVRFVSWGAAHDVGQHGVVNPKEVIKRLEPYGRVLITSERKLDTDLEKYRVAAPPEKLHDLLYYAMLYIGEGATIATEAAILGTPSLYISSLSGTMGNFEELESKYDLVYSFRDQEDAVNKATQLLQVADSKERWAKKREGLLADKIDVTQFMVDFIENYPESLRSYKDKGVVTSKSA